ncbi:MAG: Flp pilus assembly protein CpaB [Chloroflexota bacterium]
MKRLRGLIFLAAGLVLALMAGVVGFAVLSRATSQGGSRQAADPKAMVVVAARPVSTGSVLSADDLLLASVSAKAIPEGAIRKVEEAEGKLALSDLYTGEVMLTQRLLDPNVITADGRMALVLAADKVLMAFPALDLMSRIGVLKPGDQVDLLYTVDFPTPKVAGDSAGIISAGGAGADQGLYTFGLLQNVTISAVVLGGKAPAAAATSAKAVEVRPAEALLVTLSPQDALVLKYMKDAGGVVDIVLRSPGVDRPFTTDPVDAEYIMNRYRILRDLER